MVQHEAVAVQDIQELINHCYVAEHIPALRSALEAVTLLEGGLVGSSDPQKRLCPEGGVYTAGICDQSVCSVLMSAQSAAVALQGRCTASKSAALAC